MSALFLKGLAFGFILAATVGPMWILCFRRTVAYGPMAGLASGMGIAVADAIYGSVAAFGLTAVSGFLLEHELWLGLAGSAFLLWLGMKTLLAPAQALDGAGVERLPAGAAFASTLGLTLTNPPTILAFAAIFAGLGLAASATWASAALVVLGVFLGSASWWIALPLAAARLRERIGPRTLRGINLVSGVSILGLAAWQLARLVR